MDFNKRAAETFKLLLEFVTFSLSAVPKPDSTSATLTPEGEAKVLASFGLERDHFTKKVPDYYVARQTRLNELITAMDAVFSSGRDPEPIWRQSLQNLLDDASKIMGPILVGIDNPTPRAAALKWKITAEEDIFTKRLMECGAAIYWQEIAKVHKSVPIMMNTLRVSWDSLTSKMREFDERARPPTERMRTVMDSCQSFGNKLSVEVVRTAVKNLAALLPSTESYADLRRKAEAEFSALDLFISATVEGDGMRARLDTYRSGLMELSDLQDRETGGVHVIYRDMRQDPAGMIAEPPPRKARELMDKTRDKLSSWRSSLPPASSAMQEEGTDLGTALIQQLESIVRLIDVVWGDFLREFDGKFFNTLSTNTVSTLMYAEAWNARAKAIASPDYGVALRKIRSDLDWDFGQDLQSKADVLIELISRRADDGGGERDRLVNDLKRRRDDAVNRLRARRDGLLPPVLELISLLEGSTLAKVLNREAVERSLRA